MSSSAALCHNVHVYFLHQRDPFIYKSLPVTRKHPAQVWHKIFKLDLNVPMCTSHTVNLADTNYSPALEK